MAHRKRKERTASGLSPPSEASRTRGLSPSFEKIYQEYAPEIRVQCRCRLDARADAEDAVQETFLRAWRAFPSFDNRRDVRPWLHVIARNVCIDIARKDRSSPIPSEELERFPPKNPGYPVEDSESVEQLVQALGDLAPHHREVLQLREYLGWTYEEMATYQHVEVATIKTRIFRARRALRFQFMSLRESRPAAIATLALARVRAFTIQRVGGQPAFTERAASVGRNLSAAVGTGVVGAVVVAAVGAVVSTGVTHAPRSAEGHQERATTPAPSAHPVTGTRLVLDPKIGDEPHPTTRVSDPHRSGAPDRSTQSSDPSTTTTASTSIASASRRSSTPPGTSSTTTSGPLTTVTSAVQAVGQGSVSTVDSVAAAGQAATSAVTQAATSAVTQAGSGVRQVTNTSSSAIGESTAQVGSVIQSLGGL